jgi:hypothetical protein
MAKNLPKWEKQWMSHPLWIIIGLLMTLGISPNLIEILLIVIVHLIILIILLNGVMYYQHNHMYQM